MHPYIYFRSHVRNWLKQHIPKPVRVVACVLALLIVLQASIAFVLGSYYQHKHRNDPIRIGVSFSQIQTTNFGLDWKETYLAILDDLNVKQIRLMSYWSLLEKEQGKVDFTDLDWQMNEAAKRSVKVSLAVGIKQPRWPECHKPDWFVYQNEQQLQDTLFPFVKKVVEHYKDHPALQSYQMENEAANEIFAKCYGFNQDRIKKEYELIKSIDSTHQVIINVTNQQGIPFFGQVGDRVGFTIYKKANIDAPWGKMYFNFWFVPSWWHAYRAQLITLIKDREVFGHEIQAEPWGPTDIWNMDDAEQFKSMNPGRLKDIVQFTEDTGLHDMYLWGAEWWYWRKVTKNDPVMWQTAKDLIVR